MAETAGVVHSTSDGGIAASHPIAEEADVLVGSSTSTERNVVTAGLIPVACWKVDDIRFEFDSSFVLPVVAEEVSALANLRELHKKPVTPRTSPDQPQFIFPPLSIFGHADPVGNDEYNKFLSGRRAAAIYGLLTRRDDIWEDLFSNKGSFTQPVLGDKWAIASIQTMLTALGFGPVPVSGEEGPETSDAVRAFQSSQGLFVNGDAGPQTRKKLFLAYMDKLCGAHFKLDKEDDFLARGKDAHGKGDYQGCGEFNPILIFSEQKNKAFEQATDKSARNEANAPNRRVMALLFRPGSRVLFSKWPCPRVKEDVTGCVKRFWSDGQQRRSTRLADEDRKFEDKQDTFGCRFYQRMSNNSPCNRNVRTFRIRLYDPRRRFIAFAPCEVTLGKRTPFSDKADASGILTLKDVEVPTPCTIRWGFKPDEGKDADLIFTLDVFLDIDDEVGENKNDEARQKLNNLGYCNSESNTNVSNFQRDFGQLANTPLKVTGELDNDTLELIRRVYREHHNDLLHPANS